MDQLLAGLKASGEPTRLRLLALLARSELTVTELTQILRQSQPRVSRHLKLMCEGGLLDRFPEGSWVFYRLCRDGAGARLVERLIELLPVDDETLTRDLERLESVRQARVDRASAYFSANAEQWDKVRSLYIPEREVEAALLDLAGLDRAGQEPIGSFLDLGTGTGRMLEIFGPRVERGLGIDFSAEMLALARAGLERAGLANCSVRQGDLLNLPLPGASADLVTMHQVLHYLDEPGLALMEAARVLKPGGRLLVADFAPHELDFLREQHAHLRLGFDRQEVEGWLRAAGLETLDVRALPPAGTDGGGLTVQIWASRKPGAMASPEARVNEQKEEANA
ncbi:MAG: metalloregulator ArsR/SmtB family transcription factor [Parvibaculaceae bacterium]|nr:metalloregulator ArsR/SmtB family transcription factor [Parvibaculaceae bacterium]